MEKINPKYVLGVVVFVSLINVSPQFYSEYKKTQSNSAINSDDTIRDVVQKLEYYNRPIIDRIQNPVVL